MCSHEREISHLSPDYTAMSAYFGALITKIGTLRNRNTFVRRAFTEDMLLHTVGCLTMYTIVFTRHFWQCARTGRNIQQFFSQIFHLRPKLCGLIVSRTVEFLNFLTEAMNLLLHCLLRHQRQLRATTFPAVFQLASHQVNLSYQFLLRIEHFVEASSNVSVGG